MSENYYFQKSIESVHGHTETGTMTLFNGNGEKVGDYGYTSGPFRKGHIPLERSYNLTSGKLEPFTAQDKNNKTKIMTGIRIDDSSFPDSDRDHFWIHESTIGTLGCIGINHKDWAKFCKDYASIPSESLPRSIVSCENDIAQKQMQERADLSKAMKSMGPEISNMIKNSYIITNDDASIPHAPKVNKANYLG